MARAVHDLGRAGCPIHKATTGTAFVSCLGAVETLKPNIQRATEWSRHLLEKLTVAQLLRDLLLRRIGFDSRIVTWDLW